MHTTRLVRADRCPTLPEARVLHVAIVDKFDRWTTLDINQGLSQGRSPNQRAPSRERYFRSHQCKPISFSFDIGTSNSRSSSKDGSGGKNENFFHYFLKGELIDTGNQLTGGNVSADGGDDTKHSKASIEAFCLLIMGDRPFIDVHLRFNSKKVLTVAVFGGYWSLHINVRTTKLSKDIVSISRVSFVSFVRHCSDYLIL